MDPVEEWAKMTTQQREDLITTSGIFGIIVLDGGYQLLQVLGGHSIDNSMVILGIGAICTLTGVNITQLAAQFGIKL
jgi:hypothetical protein